MIVIVNTSQSMITKSQHHLNSVRVVHLTVQHLNYQNFDILAQSAFWDVRVEGWALNQLSLSQSESGYQWTLCTVFSGVKWKTWLNDDINQGLSAGVSSQNEAPWMEVLDPGARARCILARCPDISRYGKWYIQYFLKTISVYKTIMMNIQAQTWPRQSRVIYWIIGIYDQEICREKTILL